MILIAEPTHFGDTHVQVNSALIAMLQHNFSEQKIKVVAEQKHCDSLKSNLHRAFENVSFQGFDQYSQDGKFYWFQKIWGEWKQVLKVRALARHQKPELLVWLSLFPTGHLLLQLLNWFSFSKQKQVIILHGELEYFETAPKISEKFLQLCLKMAFKISSQNSLYIVLGESIKRNMSKFSFLPHSRIFALNHPFLYRQTVKADQFLGPLRICTLGTLKKSKNVHLYFNLAQRFEKEIKDFTVYFVTVGKIFGDIIPYQNAFVTSFKPTEFLNQKEYELKIAENDLALFFYDESMYKLSASGALHEALNNNLSVLSLQNDYFVGIANQTNSVRCVKDLDEMEEEIRIILNANRRKINERSDATQHLFIQQNSFLLQVESLKVILQNLL